MGDAVEKVGDAAGDVNDNAVGDKAADLAGDAPDKVKEKL